MMMNSTQPLHCKILQADVCELQTVKQPFFKAKKGVSSNSVISYDSSSSSTSLLCEIQNEVQESINTSVITIQTFKGVNSKFIISTCYMQNEEKFSCNYSFDKSNYESFQLIPLEIKPVRGGNNNKSPHDQMYPLPKKMIKSENKIQQSKNAAKNITKAFIRYFKDLVGDNEKSYKELVKFIKKHKYNNKNLKTIAQKPQYEQEFKQFCNGPAQKWVDSCEIQDKEMHSRIILAFKNQDYEMLKEHKKRIKKRYSL